MNWKFIRRNHFCGSDVGARGHQPISINCSIPPSNLQLFLTRSSKCIKTIEKIGNVHDNLSGQHMSIHSSHNMLLVTMYVERIVTDTPSTLIDTEAKAKGRGSICPSRRNYSSNDWIHQFYHTSLCGEYVPLTYWFCCDGHYVIWTKRQNHSFAS